MKVLISLSEIPAETIDREARELSRELNNQLRKLLGKDFNVSVEYGTRLGKSLEIKFYRARNPKPANNIPMNSKSFFSFMMYLSGSFGQDKDLAKVEIEQAQGPRSVKYRKISSKKSIADAGNKFMRWIKKNLDAIKEL